MQGLDQVRAAIRDLQDLTACGVELDFPAVLVPQGATLSEIANERPKMLSKLTSVSSVLFHSEGAPPASCYAVVDEMEKLIDAEIASWKAFQAKQGK